MTWAVIADPVGYVAGVGSDNRILFGAFMELLLIIANIGTAVVLFPILRRQNESVALGYVTARIVECTFIAGGILAVLTIVTLGQETSGADAGARSPTRSPRSKDWTAVPAAAGRSRAKPKPSRSMANSSTPGDYEHE